MRAQPLRRSVSSMSVSASRCPFGRVLPALVRVCVAVQELVRGYVGLADVAGGRVVLADAPPRDPRWRTRSSAHSSDPGFFARPRQGEQQRHSPMSRGAATTGPRRRPRRRRARAAPPPRRRPSAAAVPSSSCRLARASPSCSSSVAPGRSTVSRTRKSTSLASVAELRSPFRYGSSSRNASISAGSEKTIRSSISGREPRESVPLVEPYEPLAAVASLPSARLSSSSSSCHAGRPSPNVGLPVPSICQRAAERRAGASPSRSARQQRATSPALLPSGSLIGEG